MPGLRNIPLRQPRQEEKTMAETSIKLKAATLVALALLPCAAAVTAQQEAYDIPTTSRPNAASPTVTAAPTPTPSPTTARVALTPQQRSNLAAATQRTATSITAGQSVFSYVPGCRWIERVNGQQVRSYREQGRQRNSTVLRLKNEDTDGYLTFNFYRNELNYNGTSINAPIDSVGSEVNETNVTAAAYPAGTLRLKTCSTRDWEERVTAPAPRTFTFVETGRGAGGVSMLDQARGFQLQITPSQSAIHLSTAAQPNPRLLYTTTSVTAVQFYNYVNLH
jgi:hypothetical protein